MNDASDKQDQDALADDWSAALDEQEKGGESGQQDAGEADVERAQFQNLQEQGGGEGDEDGNLDMVLDIPVNLTVEIGRTKMSIRNLLKLNQGSVVELNRLAGEPMDIYVNGTLIAHGEVVVVNEKFGIRLTDVISATERVKKLK